MSDFKCLHFFQYPDGIDVIEPIPAEAKGPALTVAPETAGVMVVLNSDMN